MKKPIKYLYMVLVCLLLAAVIWNLTDCATAYGSHKTMSVSFSDSWRLRAALLIKEADFVGYGCPFSEDYAVRIGGLTYCLAQDDCNSIYIKELNLYYSVSNEQHDALHEILRDYGITKK